ncbi:MAG: hypothetical protein SGI89_02420 [bacterium]|nr:hypothetical protein [bacterium]
MMKFIRLFLKNNIFKYSYLLLLFCAVSSCEQNQTVFGPSSKPRYSVFADKMNINYAFNYNHTPLGTQPIKNVFISDSLWQSPKVNMYLKTSATSAIENQLNVNSFRSFLNFFSNYLERNDLSLNNNEILSLTHSFGVANVSNTSSNTVGLATAYYYNEFEDSILLGYPSMNFVLVAKMQSMFVSQPIDLV